MAGLGGFYEKGIGVERNVHEAITLYKKAYAKGNADAMLSLGNCFENEIGVERNIFRAFNYYKNAADLGNVTAKLYLDSYRFAINMLDANTDEHTFLSTLNDKSNNYLSDLWPDIPLLIGDWFAPSVDGAFWIHSHFCQTVKYVPITLAGLLDMLGEVACRRIRFVPLSFYPGLHLADIEFTHPYNVEARYCSVIIGKNGVGPLHGKAVQIYSMNLTDLHFKTKIDPLDYLRFFCEFTYGDKGLSTSFH
jgi:hypothetical protein